jgi:hypothetical protein
MPGTGVITNSTGRNEWHNGEWELGHSRVARTGVMTALSAGIFTASLNGAWFPKCGHLARVGYRTSAGWAFFVIGAIQPITVAKPT